MRVLLWTFSICLLINLPAANAAKAGSQNNKYVQSESQPIQLALTREQRIRRAKAKRAAAERRRNKEVKTKTKYRNQRDTIQAEAVKLANNKDATELEAKVVESELKKTRDLHIKTTIETDYKKNLSDIQKKYRGNPRRIESETKKLGRKRDKDIKNANEIVTTGIKEQQKKIKNADKVLTKKRKELTNVQNKLDKQIRKIEGIDKEIEEVDKDLKRLGVQPTSAQFIPTNILRIMVYV